jgi:hypothetical protein
MRLFEELAQAPDGRYGWTARSNHFGGNAPMNLTIGIRLNK